MKTRPSDKVTDDEYRARIEAQVVKAPNGCWEWQGWLHPKGYGYMSYRCVHYERGNKMTREELQAAVKAAQANVVAAQKALEDFEALPANNVYETLAKAVWEVENKLEKRAHQDCEGAYNCGQPTYTQGFIVDGVEYLGTLSVEYNRHDKTYYYIEEQKFTYKPVVR